MVAARPSTASPDPLSLNVPGPETEDDDLIVIQRVPQSIRPSTPTRKTVVKTPVKTPAGRKRKAQSDEEQDVPPPGAGGSTLKRNPSKRSKKTVDVSSVSKPRGKAAQALKAASAQEEPRNGASSSKGRKDALDSGKGLGSGSRPRTPRKKAIAKAEDPSDLTPRSKSTRKARTPRAAVEVEARPEGKAGRERSPGATAAEEDGQGSSSNTNSDSNDEGSDEEDAFELDSKTSRTKFLENERRRKLNQARNFVFTGDVTEARKTRSGKTVVVDAELDLEEEEDGMVGPGEEAVKDGAVDDKEQDGEMDIDLGVDIDYTIPEDLIVQEEPLEPPTPATTTVNQSVAPFIQEKLNRILSNLSAPPSWDPEPFETEGPENEALTSLVNLLSGTIGRGEGNSCLVVGSKGSGKSRVSTIIASIVTKVRN